MERDLYRQHHALDERHWWFVGRRRVVAALLRTLGLGSGRRILDVGSGGGGMIETLLPYGTVSALEGDAESVSEIRRRYADRVNVIPEFVTPDTSALHGQDVITLFDVLEHLDEDDAFVRNAFTALPPGGKLILTVPAFPSLWSRHDVASHHKRRYTRRGLIRLLESHGFHIRRITFFNALLFPLAALQRFFQRNKEEAKSDVEDVPAPLNAILRWTFSLERFLAPQIDLPFGVSLFVCAEKPVGSPNASAAPAKSHGWMAAIRHHWVAPLQAVVVAALVLIPAIAFPSLAGDRYRGINIVPFEGDQYLYLSRLNDALAGHGLGNSILIDGKDGTDPFSIWNERILAAPFQLLPPESRPSAAVVALSANAIGLALLACLIYALAFQMTRRRLIAAVMPLLVIAGSSVVFARGFFFSDLSLYARSPLPYFSSLVLFAFLNACWRAWETGRRSAVAWSAILLGVAFYVYFFCWIYIVTFLGTLGLASIILRRWDDLKRLIAIGLGGIALGLPYLISLFGHFFTASRDLTYFHSGEHSRLPISNSVSAAALAVLAATAFLHQRESNQEARRRSHNEILFLASLIIAGLIALNQQVITGLRIQPGHFHWYFVTPLCIFACVSLVRMILPRRLMTACVIVVTLLVSGALLRGQWEGTMRFLDRRLEEQRYAPLLRVLEREQRESVVLMYHKDTAYLVVAETKHDLFWHDSAALYLVGPERIRDAFVVQLLLNSDARKDIRAFLEAAANRVGPHAYNLTYQMIEGYATGLDQNEYVRRLARNDESLLPTRQRVVQELAAQFSKALADPNGLDDLLKKYRVQYAVWDDRAPAEWDVQFIQSKTEILSQDGLHLYLLDTSTVK